MLEDQWLVQIYANDNDGDPRIGTGYLIGNNLILTARHVVLFAERAAHPQLRFVVPERNESGEIIKENAHNYFYDSKKSLSFSDDDIVFKGNEQLDLAVIRSPTPLSYQPQKIALATVQPFTTDKWFTRGFPKAGKVGTLKREQLGIDVDFQGIRTESIFELHTTVNLNEVLWFDNSKNSWAGLSGAPVFADNQLVAIITDSHNNLKNYFYAISIPYLLVKNDSFRSTVGLDKTAVLNDVIANLRKKIIFEITPALEKNQDLLTELLKELGLDYKANGATVANHLVEELSIGDAVGSLVTVSLDLERQLSRNDERWQQYLHDIEQVCGWLLILSVDDDWWFENTQCFTHQTLTNELELEERAFIEIIISRNLIQQAQYDLNEQGELIPTNASRIDDTLIFDATPNASDIQLLSFIYKDLRRCEAAPQNIDKLLEEIGKTAKKLYKRRKNKIIYYLVSSDYLKTLQASTENFKKLEKQVNGYLQFICCITNSSSNISASKEEQSSLLEDVATILRLKNPKSLSHAKI